jgi:hypothetical protein
LFAEEFISVNFFTKQVLGWLLWKRKSLIKDSVTITFNPSVISTAETQKAPSSQASTKQFIKSD